MTCLPDKLPPPRGLYQSFPSLEQPPLGGGVLFTQNTVWHMVGVESTCGINESMNERISYATVLKLRFLVHKMGGGAPARLSFLLCKMGTMTRPPLQGCSRRI